MHPFTKIFPVCLTIIGIGVLSGCQNGETTEITLPSVTQILTPKPVPVAPNGAINGHAINAGTTVASLASLPDDSQVRLTGKLVRALGDDRYEFGDSTGTVIVDIDNELWGGRAVGANDTITLVGELDKSLNPLEKMEIDVDLVEFH